MWSRINNDPRTRVWRRSKAINLALQGGGAHGAFTWGVLDRLLEHEGITIKSVSATSSGAMNAVMLAYGLADGGPEGARALLAQFWARVASQVPFAAPNRNAINRLEGPALEPTPWFQGYLEFARVFSPYVANPAGHNLLRDIVGDLIDFDRLRRRCPVKLFIAATRVRSGKIEIFRNPALSLEALMASTCIPTLHHAVEIEGEPYWDGGFSGNPAVLPLIFECHHPDIVIVMLHPASRPDTPVTGKAISEHMTELAFNSAFLREMGILSELKVLAEKGLFPFGRIERRLRRVRFHLIEKDELLPQLSPASRFNTREPFLQLLRDQGREHAERWLEQTYREIGIRSSFDYGARFAQ